MEAQQILLLLSLGIIVVWTTRLARSKGLNPWMWGIGSVLLIALAWNIGREFLGPVVMAPLIFLLLFRSPLFRRSRKDVEIPCPSCGAPYTGGLNFCVQCGWDLSRIPEDAAQAGEEGSAGEPETAGNVAQAAEAQAEDANLAPSPLSQPQTDAGESTPVQEPVASGPVAQDPASEAASGSDTAAGTAPEPVPDSAPVPEPQPALAQDAVANPEEPPVTPPPEAAPSPAPVPRMAPTAANLTERGVTLFNQGRYQEAIDQFTKAIALDGNYREAWERRAEAYGKMGRAERQKADQRRLEAF